ncbi:hypothetical protein [Rhodococcus sp. AD45]|jgi:hypothetical protein|uniref:hypothetical protein n=1 Tax=Rhodococcus sp. (strain AD45) TaxID=103808 RepID=UPI001392242F|nr:hypothetical protein [Rhodococcus sp. AD45]
MTIFFVVDDEYHVWLKSLSGTGPRNELLLVVTIWFGSSGVRYLIVVVPWMDAGDALGA